MAAEFMDKKVQCLVKGLGNSTTPSYNKVQIKER